MQHIPGIWQQIYATPHRLAWIDVGGVRTRMLEAGPPDAPAVLLLHGTAGSLENFCANVAALAAHFRVIAIDSSNILQMFVFHNTGPVVAIIGGAVLGYGSLGRSNTAWRSSRSTDTSAQPSSSAVTVASTPPLTW